MNPFVNFGKRSVTLPAGCKDLIDVLNNKKSTDDDEKIRKFIRLVLFQALQDNATEIIIGKAPPKGETPIRYKVKRTWHEMGPFPSQIRQFVISELAQMAKFPAGNNKSDGVLDFSIGSKRSRWLVEMANADAECRIVRVQD
jgi:type II secretory ATPase GspE/PulE/Tfp pilus assembly ATPase PilB-like protein